MHKNVKTVLGIFLFFLIGFYALWDISEWYSNNLKALGDSMPVLSFFNPELLALVFTPLIVATAWRAWSGESHWSSVWFHSGVPLGLIASSISMNGVLDTLNIEQTRILVGESLLAVFYGGVVSFIGYSFLGNAYIQREDRRQSNIAKAFVFLLINLILAASMHFLNFGGIMRFTYLPTVAIIFAFGAAFLLINRDESKCFCQLVCEAMVMASLAAVMIAVISYNFYQGYVETIGIIINIGILGPLYASSVIFYCATFFSDKDLRATNFGRINWHLLEIYSLWILMCLAPRSMLEMPVF
jgi:integral membrane sensor domain MASE1